MGPAAIMLWTGLEPCLHTFRMTAGWLSFGRALLESRDLLVSDERMSRSHVRIDYVGNGFHVEDLASRNGTFVNGHRADDRVYPAGSILRVGRTLVALVEDAQQFVGAVDIVDGLVVGPTTRRLQARIDATRLHTVLVGGIGSGRRELAVRWARARRRPFLIYDPRTQSLERAVRHDHATLVIPEINRLRPADRPALLALLHRPNFRVLATSQTAGVDPDFQLAPIAVPNAAQRVEELPMLLHHTVRRVSPRLSVHPNTVERVLVDGWPASFLEIANDIARAAARVEENGGTLVRREDLHAQVAKNHCVLVSRSSVQLSASPA
jgi:hypothetical protein